MHLGSSKLLGTLICGKICIYLLKIHYKTDQKKTYLMMIMRYFLIFFIKACCEYSFELHLNCLYKEADKKYTACNLKTTELLDCVLVGVCVVIRSNMVYCFSVMLSRRGGAASELMVRFHANKTGLYPQ